MTVYVDNARIPATVGRIRGRWSHLTADTPDELHTFAAAIGLKRAWFQAHCKFAKCPTIGGVCRHYHYDVVDAKRDAAIGAYATPIDLREFGELISGRKEQFTNPPPPGTGRYIMQLVRPVSGEPSPYDGQWLVDYDPTRPGTDPAGKRTLSHIECTPDRARARRFPDVVAAHEYWMTESGQLFPANRPLTAFAVAVEEV